MTTHAPDRNSVRSVTVVLEVCCKGWGETSVNRGLAELAQLHAEAEKRSTGHKRDFQEDNYNVKRSLGKFDGDIQYVYRHVPFDCVTPK